MRENLGDQFRVAPYLGTYYYAVNTTEKKLADPKIRRALSMAIDREFIADDIWGGTMLPGYSLVPPGIGNYGEPAYADFKGMDQFDREDKAKAILEKPVTPKTSRLKWKSVTILRKTTKIRLLPLQTCGNRSV